MVRVGPSHGLIAYCWVGQSPGNFISVKSEMIRRGLRALGDPTRLRIVELFSESCCKCASSAILFAKLEGGSRNASKIRDLLAEDKAALDGRIMGAFIRGMKPDE